MMFDFCNLDDNHVFYSYTLIQIIGKLKLEKQDHYHLR